MMVRCPRCGEDYDDNNDDICPPCYEEMYYEEAIKNDYENRLFDCYDAMDDPR